MTLGEYTTNLANISCRRAAGHDSKKKQEGNLVYPHKGTLRFQKRWSGSADYSNVPQSSTSLTALTP